MFDNLKWKYINWKISGVLSSQKRVKEFINWENVKSIVFIFDSATMKKETRDYIVSKLNGRQYCTWTTVESVEKKKETVNGFMISPKDTNLFDKPKDAVLEKFSSIKADILIDLTIDDIRPLKYLTAISTAKCKCGLAKNDDNLLDFKIQFKKGVTVKDLFDQIIFYLDMIKTK